MRISDASSDVCSSDLCLPLPPPDGSSPLWTLVDSGQRPRHARREGETKMLPASTYSRSIDREWRSLYDLIWRPEFFPRWASGLSKAGLRQDGDGWLAEGTEGPIRIRFTPHNDYGDRKSTRLNSSH